MKDLIRVLFYRNPIKFLQKKGIHIGNDVHIIVYPYFWSLPLVGSGPYLISIGDNTCISYGVNFLTHDGAVGTVRKNKKYKDVIKFGEIKIGNNCFIGCNSTIMPNVVIGNNCIVGACSLVTKDIPNDEVWAGNPAKFICTIGEYAEKMLVSTPKYDAENLQRNPAEESKIIADLYMKNKIR